MSRIGKKPIVLPEKVEVSIVENVVTVKGPKGTLTFTTHPQVSAAVVETDGVKQIAVTVQNEDETSERALWGTTRAILANLVKGVTEGFSKSLELNGVGFKVNLSGKKFVFSIGFSHDVEFLLPEGIDGKVEKNIITISGIDRQVVGETAASIRHLKPPEPYLGKGIKYVDEVIRRKAGKTAKTSE